MSQIRIGDAERDTAATALGEHYATGRLTKAEYDERINRVWSARFEDDLRPLFADLPAPPSELSRSAPTVPTSPRRRLAGQWPPRWLPSGGLVPVLGVALIGAALISGNLWMLFLLFWVFAGFSHRRSSRPHQSHCGRPG